MVIASPFTIAKTWKQLKCPSTDEWIKEMLYLYICYIYTYILKYYSAVNKNKTMSSAVTWMDLEMIILSEESHTEEDKYHMRSLICGV